MQGIQPRLLILSSGTVDTAGVGLGCAIRCASIVFAWSFMALASSRPHCHSGFVFEGFTDHPPECGACGGVAHFVGYGAAANVYLVCGRGGG